MAVAGGCTSSISRTESDVAERPRRVELTRWLLFVTMSGIWGSSYFWTKIALRGFAPGMIVTLRMAIAGATLGLIVAVRKVRMPGSARDYAVLVGLSVLNVTIPFTMITWGQQHVSSALTAVLSSTTPLFVFAYVSILGRDERFTWWRLVGTCVAFGGIAFLAIASGSDRAHDAAFSVGGAAVIVGSSAVFGAGNLVSRRITRSYSPLVVAFVQSSTGCLFELPVVAASAGWHMSTGGAEPWLALLWLGVLGSALTYVLYFYFIRVWGSTRTSLNTYLQPIVGVALGVFVLGETLTASMLGALGIVLAGVLLFVVATARAGHHRLSPQPDSAYSTVY